MARTIRVGSGMNRSDGNAATRHPGTKRGKRGGCSSCRGK